MIWQSASDECLSNIFTGVESPSMDQWYTDILVTNAKVFRDIHFQKTTSSVIVWAFIFDFISMLKICSVFWAVKGKHFFNHEIILYSRLNGL